MPNTKKMTLVKKGAGKRSAKSTRKAERKAAAKKAVQRATMAADAKITKLVPRNPRREGTFGHKSFSLIKNGMTVEQFTAKGGRRKDLRWDVEHGYAKIA